MVIQLAEVLQISSSFLLTKVFHVSVYPAHSERPLTPPERIQLFSGRRNRPKTSESFKNLRVGKSDSSNKKHGKKTQWFLKSSRMFCLHQDLAHITVDGQDMDSAGAARWVNGDILIQPVSPLFAEAFLG